MFQEALTMASTKSERNNEALEFLGESVLNLLVVIELFIFEPYDKPEAYLSFLKQWRVSNMRLARKCLDSKLFQFISFLEKMHRFEVFTPSGFEPEQFHQRLKQKQINEDNNKLKGLRRINSMI